MLKNKRGLLRAPMNNGCSVSLFVFRPTSDPNYESDAREPRGRKDGKDLLVRVKSPDDFPSESRRSALILRNGLSR